MSDYIRIQSYHNKGLIYYSSIEGITEKAKKLEYKGVNIDNIGKPFIRFNNKNAKVTDFVMGIGRFPIVSNRFKEILENLEDSKYIQFIPCKSNYSKKSEIFWIMNLLESIDCFDWEKSEYVKHPYAIDPNKFWPDEIKNVEMLNEKIGQRNIFRMIHADTIIFISKYLESIILKEKLKLTLVRTQDLTKVVDSDPNDARLAKWGHETID